MWCGVVWCGVCGERDMYCMCGVCMRACACACVCACVCLLCVLCVVQKEAKPVIFSYRRGHEDVHPSRNVRST